MERRLFGDGSIVHSIRISRQKYVILSQQNKSTPQHPCMACSPTYLLHLVDLYDECRYCKYTIYIYTFMVWEQNKIFRGPWIFSAAWLWTNKLGAQQELMEGSNKNDVKGWQTRMFIPINIHNICIKNAMEKKTSWGMTRCLGNSGEPEPLGSSTKIWGAGRSSRTTMARYDFQQRAVAWNTRSEIKENGGLNHARWAPTSSN